MRLDADERFPQTFVQPPQHLEGTTLPLYSTAISSPELTPELPLALPVEVGADEEWLQEEKDRLEAYLARHLNLLRAQREELARMQSEAEAELLTREFELNRQVKSATRHDQELTLREAALDARAEREAEAEEGLRRLFREQEQVQHDLETQREILEQLLLEVDQVRDRARVAKKDYDSLRRAARRLQADQLEWQNRLEQLERRERKLQQEEEALQRRSLENDELEDQLRRELEGREQELALENRDLEQRRQELAMESLEKDYQRRKLGALNEELDTQRTQPEKPAKKDRR